MTTGGQGSWGTGVRAAWSVRPSPPRCGALPFNVSGLGWDMSGPDPTLNPAALVLFHFCQPRLDCVALASQTSFEGPSGHLADTAAITKLRRQIVESRLHTAAPSADGAGRGVLQPCTVRITVTGSASTPWGRRQRVPADAASSVRMDPDQLTFQIGAAASPSRPPWPSGRTGEKSFADEPLALAMVHPGGHQEANLVDRDETSKQP